MIRMVLPRRNIRPHHRQRTTSSSFTHVLVRLLPSLVLFTALFGIYGSWNYLVSLQQLATIVEDESSGNHLVDHNSGSVRTTTPLMRDNSSMLPPPTQQDSHPETRPPPPPVPAVVKNILYYTPYWNHADFAFGFGSEPFQTKCASAKQLCFATNNRSHLASMGDFDAILFHYVDFNVEYDAPLTQAWRKPHQRFVYMNLESPDTVPMVWKHPANFYNWTMTYRHDSDIVRPYGWFQDKTNNAGADRGKNAHTYLPSSASRQTYYQPWRVIPSKEQDHDVVLMADAVSSMTHLAKRPNRVAWIVSNCNTPSGRDDYTRELAKYIPVDIFGKCGNYSCNLNYQEGQNQIDNCTFAIGQNKYKYYLSFENSICTNYVTEKLYSRMEGTTSSLLPIVLGGANYASVAPPHSYINVMDYPSPKALAEYLHTLHRNDSLYLSYFWWKQHYDVKSNQADMQAYAFCRLCAKLHDEGEPPKSYENIKEWWTTGGRCAPGKAAIPGLANITAATALPTLNVKVDWEQAG